MITNLPTSFRTFSANFNKFFRKFSATFPRAPTTNPPCQNLILWISQVMHSLLDDHTNHIHHDHDHANANAIAMPLPSQLGGRQAFKGTLFSCVAVAATEDTRPSETDCQAQAHPPQSSTRAWALSHTRMTGTLDNDNLNGASWKICRQAGII